METEKKLADYLSTAKYEDLPKKSIGVIKEVILTVVGTTIAGAADEGCEVLANQVKEWGGKKRPLYLFMVAKYQLTMLLLLIARWPVP